MRFLTVRANCSIVLTYPYGSVLFTKKIGFWFKIIVIINSWVNSNMQYNVFKKSIWEISRTFITYNFYVSIIIGKLHWKYNFQLQNLVKVITLFNKFWKSAIFASVKSWEKDTERERECVSKERVNDDLTKLRYIGRNGGHITFYFTHLHTHTQTLTHTIFWISHS